MRQQRNKGFFLAIRRALSVYARPLKSDFGRGGLIIHPYRGYGSHREVFLMGRVFQQHGFGNKLAPNSLQRDLIDVLRRLIRKGKANINVMVSFNGANTVVSTDEDGYFEAYLPINEPLEPDRIWYEAELRLLTRNMRSSPTTTEVYIPPAHVDFAVISDIDDTVMYTGVANKLKMLYRLFFEKADRRAVFPGVAAFYLALYEGNNHQQRPMLYVSRGPWSIYEMLEEFFKMHRIPVGPVLFLREWGMKLWRPIPRRARNHKLRMIRRMLKLYDQLPFVLIGDSGQQDPEVYTKIVREFPTRIKTIYIRAVEDSEKRDAAIAQLANQVSAAGSTLVLAQDTATMARHALSQGYISKEGLAEVLQEEQDELKIKV